MRIWWLNLLVALTGCHFTAISLDLGRDFDPPRQVARVETVAPAPAGLEVTVAVWPENEREKAERRRATIERGPWALHLAPVRVREAACGMDLIAGVPPRLEVARSFAVTDASGRELAAVEALPTTVTTRPLVRAVSLLLLPLTLALDFVLLPAYPFKLWLAERYTSWRDRRDVELVVEGE
jgi:hypothetical protein